MYGSALKSWIGLVSLAMGLILLSNPVQSNGLMRVIGTEGDTITLSAPAGMEVSAGARIRVGYTTPDGDYIEIGTWRITKVEGRQVRAEKVEAFGEVTVGVDAEVISPSTDTEPAVSDEERYRKGCEAGDAESCTSLGYMYRKGLGVARNEPLAAELYRRGCEGGNARGCKNLGYLYERGLGVARDYLRAVDLYERACEAEYSNACTNLGYMYRRGLGAERDERKALALYRRGCEAGSALGCTNLGVMYRKGYGVKRDERRAAELYRRGCDEGDGRGCKNLAYLYDEGVGVERDERQAARLRDKACELDDEYCD